MHPIVLCLAVGAWTVPQGSIPDGQPDSLMARAESLLAARQLPEARHIAEGLLERAPHDGHVLILLGRIHLAWPVVGRFTAHLLFTRAAELLPGNPEPLYYAGMVGMTLSGDDGEAMARRAFVAVLAINPDYRDTWSRWLTLYRRTSERQEALDALTRHAGTWSADYWRAQLLHELKRYDESAALLERAVQRRPADPGPWAWLARARFSSGDDDDGARAYDSALARAVRDTGEVLWRQVRSIASPEEKSAWTQTAATGRAGYFRRFWSIREPDLTTSLNERLGQHFRRMAEAQRIFGLRHPNTLYFRSPLARARLGEVGRIPQGHENAEAKAPDPLAGGLAGEEPRAPNRPLARANLGDVGYRRGGIAGAELRALASQCTAHLPGGRQAEIDSGFRPRVETSRDSVPNLEDMLDDRGRVFVRHGPPTYRLIGSVTDETWCYFRPDGTSFRVTFARRTGGGGAGDMIVTPVLAGEAESARELLATDGFGDTSTLSFAFWPAAFRAARDRGRTELLVIPDSLWAVAALVDDTGREVARDSATGRPLRLEAVPGRYQLLLDAAREAKTGLYRGWITLPDYGNDLPAVSSILLASGDTPPLRDSIATVAPHGLVLPVDQPLRVYAELYNMGRVDSVSRYVAEYRFERTDGFILRSRREHTTTVGFERTVAFAPRLVETLVVDPGRLPPGRYRLYIEIEDKVRGQRTASSVIEFRLR